MYREMYDLGIKYVCDMMDRSGNWLSYEQMVQRGLSVGNWLRWQGLVKCVKEYHDKTRTGHIPKNMDRPRPTISPAHEVFTEYVYMHEIVYLPICKVNKNVLHFNFARNKNIANLLIFL